MDFQVGNVYELDHSYLLPTDLIQLKVIRAVMVSQKTEVNVVVSYPSLESLRVYLDYGTRDTHPALTEKFVMGISVAEKVLHRLVTPESFMENKGSEDFWVVKGDSGSSADLLSCNGRSLGWGIRRQVKYLVSDENLDVQEKVNVDGNVKEEEDEEDEEVEDEEDRDGDDIEDEEEEEELVKKGPKRNRYNVAEKSLLEVLKEKEATHEKPILRPGLTFEPISQKVGDTSLLDHHLLIKPVAGKVAPNETTGTSKTRGTLNLFIRGLRRIFVGTDGDGFLKENDRIPHRRDYQKIFIIGGRVIMAISGMEHYPLQIVNHLKSVFEETNEYVDINVSMCIKETFIGLDKILKQEKFPEPKWRDFGIIFASFTNGVGEISYYKGSADQEYIIGEDQRYMAIGHGHRLALDYLEEEFPEFELNFENSVLHMQRAILAASKDKVHINGGRIQIAVVDKSGARMSWDDDLALLENHVRAQEEAQLLREEQAWIEHEKKRRKRKKMRSVQILWKLKLRMISFKLKLRRRRA